MQLENLGSLITIAGTDNCLGYLMNFPGKGTFDATYGKVDVNVKQMNVHNKLLDQTILNALDEYCMIGEGSTFYLHNNSPTDVRTFLGTLVSDNVTLNGKVVTFHRNGKTYRGRTKKYADCFNFRRIK